MEYKKITIFVIANNDIDACLENLSNQTYIKDMELILLYNKTQEEIIDKIKTKYENIKYILAEKNIFSSIKKNENLITGSYVTILNSEDTLTVDYYRTMTKKAVDQKADIVISNSVLKYLDGGKAYLNLSEASLKDFSENGALEEYLKMSTVSFLWNIYSNKIYTKDLFLKTVNEIYKLNMYIQNLYFFAIMFYYSNSLAVVNNEVVFYGFEQENSEAVRELLKKGRLDNSKNLYANTEENFKCMQEFIVSKNLNLEELEELKKIYLNENTDFKKDILTNVKTAWNDNLEKIKNEIISEKTKIVSFDIFDTLILRPFWNPIDLFTFLDNYFKEITKMETGMNFSKIRLDAEQMARNKFCIKENIQEITLDQIYEEIKNITKLDENVIEALKNKEKELEIKFCMQRKTAKEIYDLAKYLNKKIICTSDMYLPIVTIRKMIEKNGYDISKIYLSSEIKLTKFSGDLYTYVIKDLQIESEEIVHIGDNYYSDYEQAKKQKINAMFLPKAVDVFCNKNITNALGEVFTKNIPMWEDNKNGLNFLGIRSMLAIVANRYFDNPFRTFNNETDFNCDPNLVGYYALGMHLYGIANWLIKDSTEKNYEKIVFCARDGYWTMRAYEILKKYYANVPEEKYLYISRRAIIPITLNNRMDFFKLSELIDIYKYTPKTILKYIKNILYNSENLEEECQKNNIDLNKKFENRPEFNNYMNLIIEKFYDKEKHIKVKENLKKYFNMQLEGMSAIFDIGYSAKPELYLSKLCEKPIDTYFINISNEEALQNSYLGNFKLQTYFDNRPAITGVVRESLMSTADSSCIGYDLDNMENVIPIFEENKENYQKRFVFDAMQNKAMEFLEDITNIFKENIKDLTYQKYYISLPHEMYINSPKKIDQEIFYGIDFEDSVGLGEEIPAIDEWNKELNEKNQKRTNEIFDVKLAKEKNKETESLQLQIKQMEEEKVQIIRKNNDVINEKNAIIENKNRQIKENEEKYKEKENELNKVYNSKRWKTWKKIDLILGRKNKCK